MQNKMRLNVWRAQCDKLNATRLSALATVVLAGVEITVEIYKNDKYGCQRSDKGKSLDE